MRPFKPETLPLALSFITARRLFFFPDAFFPPLSPASNLWPRIRNYLLSWAHAQTPRPPLAAPKFPRGYRAPSPPFDLIPPHPRPRKSSARFPTIFIPPDTKGPFLSDGVLPLTL